ncbi:hypothetical protein Tco_0299297 [Tanacetum coccineum]
MSGTTENRNKNKFCEFHGDKGHNTYECIHLNKQIEEAVKYGQLSHLIMELKQENNKGEHSKAVKKGETSGKDKALAIFMMKLWQRVLRRLGSIFTSVYAVVQKLKKALDWSFNSAYKALMNELVNDSIKLSKLEINTSFINELPKKWLSFCQSLKNTNNVKDSELASLFGKLKYEENLIDSIYGTEKNKSLISVTPLSTAFFSSSIVQDFQDSPDDEEDTRSNHEYLNDLEEEYQARALLAKSKRFFKKAKYNKVKAKLALLSSSSSSSKASMVKNKGLIVEAYKWDEEEVSSDENEMVEVKVPMALAKENDTVSKECARNENQNLRTELKELKAITKTWLNSSNKVNRCINEQIPSQKKRILGVDQLTEDSSNSGLKDLVFVKSLADYTKVTIPGVERPSLSEVEGFILPNHDTSRILPSESQRNTTDPSVAIIESSATDYDLADESLVCSTPLPPLKKLDGAEPISGPKTIKSILRSKSTFKAKALKSVIINKPSSAPAKGNKSSPALKVHSAPVGKLKSVKIKDDPPLAIVMKELNNLKLQFSKN